MTFSVAGVEFEDVRVSIDDWMTKLKHCKCATVHYPAPLYFVYADLNSEEFS